MATFGDLCRPVFRAGTTVAAALMALITEARGVGRAGRGGGMCRTSLTVALATVALCAVFLALFLSRFHYNASALIGVGERTMAGLGFAERIAPGVIVWRDSDGYDGQYYYLIARDPFLLHGILPDAYRRQRILYPLVASLLAAGQPGALSYSLLAVNLMALGATVLLLGALLRQDTALGPWWALAGGLSAGMVVSIQNDLPDPLALAFSLAALLLYRRHRLRWAAAALALALLSKENAVLFLVALVLMEAAHHRWRGAGTLAASALPYLSYQAMLFAATGQIGLLGSGGGSNLALPLTGIAAGVAHWRYDSWPELARSGGSVLALMLVALAVPALWSRTGWPPRLYALAALAQVAFALVAGGAIWEGYTSSSRLLIALVPLTILVYGEARRERVAPFVLQALVLGFLLLSALTLSRPILVTPGIPYYVE
ncbi:MAG: hypothetical protein M1370_11865 [Bacteroidetes bacterium]|nr:hypothetical protein [Bacteroidota bacterium]MCL5025433.1 hypothetical protein [Chloroflexota bacterium]